MKYSVLACITVGMLSSLAKPVLADASDSANAQTQKINHHRAFSAVTPLNFDSGDAVSRQFHLHANAYLQSQAIAHIGPIRTLKETPSAELQKLKVKINGESLALEDYVSNDPLLDGVIVLKGGNIVFEAYPNMASWQRHFAWSVTKVFTSTAVAVLAQQGKVDMQAGVGKYVPELKNTVWEKIAVQDVANMASGIDCRDSDGYQTNTTCIYTMEESLGVTAPTGRNLDFITVLQNMKTLREPNTKNEYASANTNVLGLIIEAVTGKPYHIAVQELIWTKMGAEADGLMSVNKQGYAYASGGLQARLRDIARFGLLYTEPGAALALSADTVTEIQQSGISLPEERLPALNSLFDGDTPERAGWQWDLIWADGAVYKGGYSGQGIYVDPANDLVVAWFGTGTDYNKKRNAVLPVTRQISAAVRGMN